MRRFNHFTATVIVPLVARIVLFAAFFFVGVNKLFQSAEFDAAEAERLRELGVTAAPIAEANDAQAALSPRGPQGHSVQPATLTTWAGPSPDEQPQQDVPDEPDEPAEPREPDEPVEPEPQPDPADEEQEVEEPAAAPEREVEEDEPEPEIEPEPDVEPEPTRYRAAALHRITLTIDAAGWPLPVWQARAVAVIEMVGGALILIGLFSRVWGLLLSGVMVGAFFLVSVSMTDVHSTNPFVYVQDISNFNMVAAQLALFALAFGVLLTGPGPVSVDRLLFRGHAGAGREANGKHEHVRQDNSPSVYPQRDDSSDRI